MIETMTEKSKVLIVDDLAIGRESVNSALEGQGYEIIFAENGFEAFEMAYALQPDVILLDVMMPGMDGFETCERMRREEVLEGIPILMITAMDDQVARLRGINSGADDFISKPFNRLELRAKVKAITRLNRYRRLHEERSRYAQLIEMMPDGLMVLNARNEIVLANNTLAGLLHIVDSKDMAGQAFDIYLHPRNRKNWAELLHQVATCPGQVFNTEFELLCCDDECLSVDVSARSLEQYGEMRIQVVLRDITEKQQTRDALLASQRLADLGTLAAGVTHDIRSPLMVISGVSEGLLKRLAKGDVEHAHLTHQLEMINRNSWRIEGIMRSMMIYAHQSETETSPVNLNDIVSSTLLLVDYQIKSWKNIQLELALAESLPTLICDQSKISQALLNIVNNAHDAMPHGGFITIRTQYLADKNEVCLVIEDTGPGIPEEIRQKIFQRFFTTKPQGSGTGLGLANVAHIMEEHHGRIELKSTVGKGTTFLLFFPVPLKVDVVGSQIEDQNEVTHV